MAVLALDALPVGDYLVLAVLVAVFLLAGVVRLVAHWMRPAPGEDREREHYADEPDPH